MIIAWTDFTQKHLVSVTSKNVQQATRKGVPPGDFVSLFPKNAIFKTFCILFLSYEQECSTAYETSYEKSCQTTYEKVKKMGAW